MTAACRRAVGSAAPARRLSAACGHGGLTSATYDKALSAVGIGVRERAADGAKVVAAEVSDEVGQRGEGGGEHVEHGVPGERAGVEDAELVGHH